MVIKNKLLSSRAAQHAEQSLTLPVAGCLLQGLMKQRATELAK